MNRRTVVKLFGSVALLFGSGISAIGAILRFFRPEEANAKGAFGFSLHDVTMDRYGRSQIDHPAQENTRLLADNTVQDQWCPPEDPSKCTLKQCGCSKSQPSSAATPATGNNASDSRTPKAEATKSSDTPLLICPCPTPPPPPWPIPDLICPCPKPPPAPL